MKDLKLRLYGAEPLHIALQPGDAVRANIYPKPVTGTVQKVVGSAIYLDTADGTEVVHYNAVQLVPGLKTVKYTGGIQ